MCLWLHIVVVCVLWLHKSREIYVKSTRNPVAVSVGISLVLKKYCKAAHAYIQMVSVCFFSAQDCFSFSLFFDAKKVTQ